MSEEISACSRRKDEVSVAKSTQFNREAKKMATNNPTITERLNKIADEVEKKAKVPKTPDAKSVSEALDRVAEAVKKLP